jgi:hypothetical protein
VELAAKRIEELNEKYISIGPGIFYLFHRPRKWNKGERKWMGYERKRGKLSALNAFLRERGNNDFSIVVGDQGVLTNIKYVITLDSDTQLPRESVWKFILILEWVLKRLFIRMPWRWNSDLNVSHSLEKNNLKLNTKESF